MEAQRIQKEDVLKKVSLLPQEQLAQVVALLDKLEAEEEQKKQMYRKAVKELRGKYGDSLSSTEDFMKRKEEEKRLDF